MCPTFSAVLVLLHLLCLPASGHGQDVRRTFSQHRKFCRSVAEEIAAITASVDGILHFLAVKPEELNLDGAVLIRMGQGALISLQSSHNSVRTLISRMESIMRRATAKFRNDPSPYVEHFWSLLTRPFLFTERWRSLKRSVRTGVSLQEIEEDMQTFVEQKYDNCYVNLFGTGPNHTRCNIPQECVSMATNSTASVGYSLTHRIIYFLLMRRYGCQRNFLSTSGAWTLKLDDFVANLCRLALEQYQLILAESKRQNLKPYIQDIYLEQGVVCGFFGFDNFFHSSDLKVARHWQEKGIGCYGIHDAFRSRKLLREQTMREGCSAHETGMAVAYFGLSLNFLYRRSLELCPPAFW